MGSNNSYKLFITNRLLRLYPIYWTVFLMTILVSLATYVLSSGNHFGSIQPYYEYIDSMGIGSFFFLVFTNIILLFQDLVMFLGLDTTSGSLFFTSNFMQTSPYLFSFLLVPQAWTIGIEITFYLIAPFLVRKKLKFIFILILFCLIIKIFLYNYGLRHDPWSYRFFPAELFFFLLGTVAYHAYKKMSTLKIKSSYLKIIYVFILFCTLFYSFIPYPNKYLVYMFLFFLSIPFIFILSKKWKKDRYIGELSYPIYISHILVKMSIIFLEIPLVESLGIVVTLLTILFSILLNELISKKIEIIRQRRVKPKTYN